MRTYLVAFLLAATVSAIITPWIRTLAKRMNWLDTPDEDRNIHEAPVPRIGGIAIAAAFFTPVAGLFFLDNSVSQSYLNNVNQVVGLVLGSFTILLLGLYDDLRGLSAFHKLAGQLVVATFVFQMGYQIERIANPFGDPFFLGVLSFPVTILWMVGVINAMNLVDGLDGLATGIGLSTVGTLFVVSVIFPNNITALTTAALAGSLLGFLRYNFNPASIFLGDSGSMFTGFILAATGISGSNKSSTMVALLIPIIALGIPLMDTSLAVVRRVRTGRSIFKPDREHIHHKLLDLGLSPKQAVLVLYAVTFLLAFLALALIYANNTQAAAILAMIGITAVGVSRALG